MDQAALSPPEGYKDGGNLQAALGGALSGHVFGAQHIQQLQVIQRLQAQRAAMLAARANSGQPTAGQTINQTGTGQHQSPAPAVCTECAECAECAAKEEEGKLFTFIVRYGDGFSWLGPSGGTNRFDDGFY